MKVKITSINPPPVFFHDKIQQDKHIPIVKKGRCHRQTMFQCPITNKLWFSCWG